ncbi:MAG TPA: hypothetical protein VIK18_18970 [Pirellulales bacterium]
MVIKSVGILSVAKIMGAMYAFFGLIAGFFMFVIFSLTSVAAQGRNEMPAGIAAGVAALFFMPICYGIMGFVGGALSGFIYNLLASFVGGIELEFTPQPGQPYAAGTYAP